MSLDDFPLGGLPGDFFAALAYCGDIALLTTDPRFLAFWTSIEDLFLFFRSVDDGDSGT